MPLYKGNTIAEQKEYVFGMKDDRWHAFTKRSLSQKSKSKMLPDMVSIVTLIQIYSFLVVEVVTE
jgi:hypothetical protein